MMAMLTPLLLLYFRQLLPGAAGFADNAY